MHPLAAQITSEVLIAAIVGLVTGGAAVLSVLDRRRRDITQTWKELAEAKSAQNDELVRRVTSLETRVDVLQSAWADDLSTTIADRVVAHLDARSRP